MNGSSGLLGLLVVADFSLQPDSVHGRVHHQESSVGGAEVEQFRDDVLFAGPGISKEEIEFFRRNPKLVIRVIRLAVDPVRIVLKVFVDSRLPACGDEAARNELHIELKVFRQLSGRLDQVILNFDSAGFEFEHGRQTGDDPDSAAPFAEDVTRSQALVRNHPQRIVDRSKVARHKAGLPDANVLQKLLDPLFGRLEEVLNLRRQFLLRKRDFEFDDGHGGSR